MEIHHRTANGVCHLYFEAHNGAMDLPHCEQLFEAVRKAVADEATRVLVLWGGEDFFSNGIDLNAIHLRYNPTILAYRNLRAMNKVVRALLEATNTLTVAALRGPAAAGGVMLALGADLRYARRGVVLNPSYVNMGLSGSEYWSVLLPSLVGYGWTQKLLYEGSPLSAQTAVGLGLLHDELAVDPDRFVAEVTARAEYLARVNPRARLASKAVLNHRLLREADEQVKLELQKMKDSCNDPEFERARTAFVTKGGGEPPFLTAWHRGGGTGDGEQ